jgi:DNA-binding XRE family transcriptional regulator
MSPRPFRIPAADPASEALARFWATLGIRLRDARLARGLTVAELAARAGTSRSSVYEAETGRPTSLEAIARLAQGLGLRIETELVDPRQRRGARQDLSVDPVHSAMGEFEARHFRALGVAVGIDEPYQHYQFAGRADLIAWDLDRRALLHIENRTRFPDLQRVAGSYNAKRAYLAAAIGKRLGAGQWASQTHVIAGLWSSEVLHVLRLRTETFRALCPDPASAFEAWWAGSPPRTGTASVLVVLDPFARGRRRVFIGLDVATVVRPRLAGYVEAARRLLEAG